MNSPIGDIFIFEENKKITQITTLYVPDKEHREFVSDVLMRAQKELEEYFQGRRKEFSIPYELKGTEFQKMVWKELARIPYGQTKSYSQIAQAIGKPKAVRAVGGANHRNPVMILVPCHRVIGCNGSLTGYAGGLQKKQILLDIETKHL